MSYTATWLQSHGNTATASKTVDELQTASSLLQNTFSVEGRFFACGHIFKAMEGNGVASIHYTFAVQRLPAAEMYNL
jgi:hypothetical protein